MTTTDNIQQAKSDEQIADDFIDAFKGDNAGCLNFVLKYKWMVQSDDDKRVRELIISKLIAEK